jgi:hypothetical protein
VATIFDNDNVEITEKIDGSQFAFGIVRGELCYRSKGRQIPRHSVQENDLFYPVIQYVEEQAEKGQIEEEHWYYGETLRKPKHSTLQYDRVPLNHFALFGCVQADDETAWFPYDGLLIVADSLGVEVAQRLTVEPTPEAILAHIEQGVESQLGGEPMEGVVIKDLAQEYLFGPQLFPIMTAKFVSETFKEVNAKNWKAENTGKGQWDTFKEQFATEARWHKAIQHMAEDGTLLGEPKDIGQLMIEIKKDIGQEAKEEIVKFLWKHFGQELLRDSVRGLPEWYKEQLALGHINELLGADDE